MVRTVKDSDVGPGIYSYYYSLMDCFMGLQFVLRKIISNVYTPGF